MDFVAKVPPCWEKALSPHHLHASLLPQLQPTKAGSVVGLSIVTCLLSSLSLAGLPSFCIRIGHSGDWVSAEMMALVD